MYIGTAAIGTTPSTQAFSALLLDSDSLENVWEWLEDAFRNSWALILRVSNALVTWASPWTFQAFSDAYSFVHKHPHPFHITGWAIFFGPIIILIPCLLLLEILILLLFQLSSVPHGLTPGSIEDRFDALKDYFMDWRESLFANVEQWTAMFNNWTVEYPALLVLRLLAGAMSLCILFGIWSGW